MSTAQQQSVEATAPDPAASLDVHLEKHTEHLHGLKLVAVIASLSFVAFLLLLDVSVVSTATPRITSDFHALDDVGWYGAAYLLGTCTLQPLTGKIYGQFDMKWTFLIFVAIFELGSVICGAATSSDMLIIGRAIAGLGGSGILNGGYSLIHASAPLPKQPFYLGIIMGVAQLGILSGPLVGGAFTEYVSWRWCFYINLPCGAVAAVVFFVTSIPNIHPKGNSTFLEKLRKLDLTGFVLFAPSAIMFILALEWGGNQYAWSSATIIGLFCGAFGMIVIFVAWEHRMGKEAMIPLSILKRRVIWSTTIHFGFFVGSMLTATYYLPLYFQTVKGASPLMSGVDLLPSIISQVIFTIIAGALMPRIGYYLPVAVLATMLATIGMGLTTTFTPTTGIGAWIGYQIIMGAGRGLGFQIPIIAVQNNSPKEEVSIVNALVVFAQNLGPAIFLSLDEIIFTNGLEHYLPIYAPGISPEFVVTAGATGIREAVSAAALPGVLEAYTKSIDHVLYLGTGAAGAAFIFAFGMGWVDIRKNRAERERVVGLNDEKEQTSLSDPEMA
ncbi:MFS multidrug transporter [Exophiala viscosa]|uniref:MFS multidrug transporter n=1 Tax=Exophiala viscosa TaxID=2486360 RepID=UPI002195A949|nr:MFS multidrug transporter [Exophiala viscosa]